MAGTTAFTRTLVSPHVARWAGLVALAFVGHPLVQAASLQVLEIQYRNQQMLAQQQREYSAAHAYERDVRERTSRLDQARYQSQSGSGNGTTTRDGGDPRIARMIDAFEIERRMNEEKRAALAAAQRERERTDVVEGLRSAKAWWESRNRGKALEMWRYWADRDSGEACYHLSVAYDYGQGIPRDAAAGLNYLAKAASLGFPRARAQYGTLLASGERVTQDLAGAHAHLIAAADAGEPLAFVGLGDLYAKGAGVEVDMKKAFYWFLRAVSLPDNALEAGGVSRFDSRILSFKKGDIRDDVAGAFALMGDAYAKGSDGLGFNLEAAYFWHALAAEKNRDYTWKRDGTAGRLDRESLIRAMMALGDSNFVELPHTKSFIYSSKERAIYWWAQAASLGSGDAARRAAGASSDPVQAYRWWTVADVLRKDGRDYAKELTKYIGGDLVQGLRQLGLSERARLAGGLDPRELAQAHYEVGLFFETLLVVPEPDPAEAAKWYELARGKNGDAGYRLGMLYESGTGVPWNLEMAKRCYTSIETSFYEASLRSDFRLALIYEQEPGGGAVGFAEVRSLLESSAFGVPEAARALATRLLEGRNMPRDPALAVAWLRYSADFKDDGLAMVMLGELYESGALGSPDPARALFWFTNAIGHEGVPEDMIARCDSIAAKIDPARLQAALCGLGERQLGKGYQWGATEWALSFFDEAAKLGSADAYHWIGNAYRWSRFEEDRPTSVEFFKKAAARGVPDSQAMLSEMFFEGRYVDKDDVTACVWAWAARRRNPEAEAQFERDDLVGALKRLVRMYEQGVELPQDPVAACAFRFALAELVGPNADYLRREVLMSSMSASQRMDARVRYLSWVLCGPEGVGFDKASASHALLALVQSGDAGAEKEICRLLADGQFLSAQDPDLRLALTAAASRGNADAQFTLAELIARESGENPETEAGVVRWLEAAAKQGHPTAQARLAARSLAGRPEAEAAEASLRLLRDAARKGNLDACGLLGRLYETGEVVPEDKVRSFVWSMLGARSNEDRNSIYSRRSEEGTSQVAELLYQEVREAGVSHFADLL